MVGNVTRLRFLLGWSGGAMVLGKLPVPGRPTNLDLSRARVCRACRRLVGCSGFNGPLRQYFSLYRAVFQREGEREEKGQMRVKMSKQPQPAPTASAVGPCPTVIKIVGLPGTGSLPSTFAPPVGPRLQKVRVGGCLDFFFSQLSFPSSFSLSLGPI